jgi:GTP-binding protein
MSAPINIGVKEVLGEAARMLDELPYEPELEYEEFNVDVDDIDPNYREVYVERDGDVFVLSGGQLEKIFNSTNFNDTGSLRYLYKYIEKSGAIAKMKEMGLEEGDTVRIKGFEMEFWDEW